MMITEDFVRKKIRSLTMSESFFGPRFWHRNIISSELVFLQVSVVHTVLIAQ